FQLFENSPIGTLSTDGNLVFAVEDFALPPPPQQFQGGNAGQPALAKGIPANKLQAFNLVSGKLIWELGGHEEKAGDLADSYFLGPPLPMAGKLYALIEKQQELRLLTLDAASGRVVETQTLASTKDKMHEDVGRRTYAAHLAYGEGLLICPTNAGAVLCFDLLFKRLKWAFPYREVGDNTPQQPIQPGRRPPVQQVNPAGRNSWKVTAPVIQDGK